VLGECSGSPAVEQGREAPMSFSDGAGRAICGQMGLQKIVADKEIHDLGQNTSIESLSQTLEDRLPGT
jgi:hypothetical protein